MVKRARRKCLFFFGLRTVSGRHAGCLLLALYKNGSQKPNGVIKKKKKLLCRLVCPPSRQPYLRPGIPSDTQKTNTKLNYFFPSSLSPFSPLIDLVEFLVNSVVESERPMDTLHPTPPPVTFLQLLPLRHLATSDVADYAHLSINARARAHTRHAHSFSEAE